MTRARISPLLTAVLALGAAAIAVAAPGSPPAPPQIQLAATSGALALSNSRAGTAILAAPAMRPGSTTTGTATIGNGSGSPARLTLRARIDDETPGTGGGRLSSQLALVVADVTRPAAPAVVYTGSPARLTGAALGSLGARQRRTYRFTVTLPATAGNEIQGARLSLSFVWTAVQATPQAAPTATPTPTPVPAPQPVIALPVGCAAHGRVVVGLNPPAGTSIRRADVKVGRARTKHYKSRRTLTVRVGGRARVKVTVRLSDGRRVSASRAYRSC
jgi:hypothetical protein